MHEKIKSMAKADSRKIFSYYDDIVNNFLTEINVSQKPVNYLFHCRPVKNVTVALKKELVEAIKVISESQSIPETRIIFTAIAKFVEKNGL